MDAFRFGAREKLVYVPCIVPQKDRPDYLATVDIDPESEDYCKVSWTKFAYNMSQSGMKPYEPQMGQLTLLGACRDTYKFCFYCSATHVTS